MRPGLIQAVCDSFGLGIPIADPLRVSGGLLNTMWRVSTSNGTFAVKVLSDNEGSPTLLFDYDAAHRLELHARAAGVLAPEPVVVVETGKPVAKLPERVVVHKWVDAAPCPGGSLTVDDARRVGEILATVHGLGLPVQSVQAVGHFPDGGDWSSIATTGSRLDRPWAIEMSEAVDDLARISALIDKLSEQSHPKVFAHADVNEKNLLRDGTNIYLLDWEGATAVSAVCNLASTAMQIAGGDVYRLKAFLRGYQDVEGPLPEVDASWLTTWLAHPTYFLWFTLRRSIEPQGDDEATQQRSNETVATSLRYLRRSMANFDDTVHTLRDAAAKA